MPVSESDPSMSSETVDEHRILDMDENANKPVTPKLDDPPPVSSNADNVSNDNQNLIQDRIIAAISRGISTDGNCDEHKFNPESDGEQKKLKNGQSQSISVVVKHINLDDRTILYTKETKIPESIDLSTFKLKEIPSAADSKPIINNNASSNSHSNNGSRKSSDSRHKNEKDKHHSSSSHRSSTSTSSSVSNKHRSLERRYHASAETLKSPYLLCYWCGKKELKKWTHPECKEKCCKSTPYTCDSCLKRRLVKNDFNNDLIRELEFNKYMYVVCCPFGRGNSLQMDYDRILHLRSSEQRIVATEFLKHAFKENSKGFAQFTIAIVHNGAKYMPDILKLMARAYPTLKVTTTKMKSGTETEMTDLMTYYKKVKETYSNGTYAFDPLNETQAAGVKNTDESGGYLPEMLSLLEKSPFLSQVLPWGEFTNKKVKIPSDSDDGPIFWCRPGEQIISLDRNSRNRWNSNGIELFLNERKKNICQNDEKKLIVEELKKYRRSCSSREFLFEDRTRPHADQAWSNSFEATAAVGVIQAIHPDESPNYNRICKEIVVFQAEHLEMLEALLHIDTTAAPKQQCAEWLDDAKLNMIRQMNIHYSKLCLRDNDIYFIPRKIVHQFKTVSATLSIAWHTRINEYYNTKNVENEKVADTSTSSSSNRTENTASPVKKSSNRETNSRVDGSSGTRERRKSSSSRTPIKRRHSSSIGALTPISCKKIKESNTAPTTPLAMSSSSLSSSIIINSNIDSSNDPSTVTTSISSPSIKLEPIAEASESEEGKSNGPDEDKLLFTKVIPIPFKLDDDNELEKNNSVFKVEDSNNDECNSKIKDEK